MLKLSLEAIEIIDAIDRGGSFAAAAETLSGYLGFSLADQRLIPFPSPANRLELPSSPSPRGSSRFRPGWTTSMG